MLLLAEACMGETPMLRKTTAGGGCATKKKRKRMDSRLRGNDTGEACVGMSKEEKTKKHGRDAHATKNHSRGRLCYEKKKKNGFPLSRE